MLNCKDYYDALVELGVTLFAGVPDSLLKDFCAYVTDHAPAERHIITANEGSAVGLAMGHHLATGGVPAVYLQNSGLGNTINPVTSLAHPDIYGIPMLLIVGWRGRPGVKDEPQHVHMGRVTESALDAVGIPHVVLPEDLKDAVAATRELVERAKREATPVAVLVKKGTFDAYALQSKSESPYAMTREAAIEAFVQSLTDDPLIVSTTGMPSRELFEVREKRGEPHDTDLLTVGGMGHASQIALGVALERPDRTVYCLDGDGAALMHMGGLATIGVLKPRNYRHLVLNNGAHDSVGGQPTVAFEVDLCAVARACGYRNAVSVSDAQALEAALSMFHRDEGPSLLEVRVKKGNRKDLGRPTMTPNDLKRAFMGAAK